MSYFWISALSRSRSGPTTSFLSMDRRRQVTVVDLEHDGPAAVEERCRKAEAAVQKKLDEMQRCVEIREAATGLPMTNSEKTVSLNRNKLSIRQADSPEAGPDSASSLSAHLATKQHRRDMLGSDQPIQKGAGEGTWDESSGIKTSTCRHDQEASQTHIPFSETGQALNVPHAPLLTAAQDERCSLADGGSRVVSDIKASKKCAQQNTAKKVIMLEYTASPPAPTEVTGNFLFDELNRFIDQWLLPDETSSHAKATGTIAAGDARGRLSRDAQIVPTPSRQDLRQIPAVNTGGDWMSCFPTRCGSCNTRSTVCPLCNQSMSGVDELREPSLSRKWTRWIFRQCEEPLDLEAEFLVTPRPRLISPQGRDGCNYQPVSSPYQTHVRGITQW